MSQTSPDRTQVNAPVAVVTGAGIRVGHAIAEDLLRSGFDVVLHAFRSVEKLAPLQRLAAELGRAAVIEQADLRSLEETRALGARIAARFPVIDLMVHNAGLFEAVPFEDVTPEQWRTMQAVNLEAPAFLTQALLPALRASKAPSIVHVIDIGAERPYPGFTHYSVSKAGLLMLTRALALELAPHIRVNGVSPGTVAFPEWYTEQDRARELARIPLQREGSPTDIASAVRYLALHAPYLTGQVIHVDGGRSCLL